MTSAFLHIGIISNVKDLKPRKIIIDQVKASKLLLLIGHCIGLFYTNFMPIKCQILSERCHETYISAYSIDVGSICSSAHLRTGVGDR